MKYTRTNFNENYFEKIDTEEKAYFLGFIIADGYLLRDTPTTIKKAQDRLVIRIQEKDRNILDILNDRITPYKQLTKWKYKNPNWSEQVIFKVNSNKLCSDLEKHGVFVGKKSGKEKLPNIDKKLIPHFIRGYFDGDGCCYNKTINKSCKHGGKIKNKVIFVCLNKEYLKKLKEELNNIGIIKEKSKNGNRQNVFEYIIENKPETNFFFNYIYNNATIFLKRKYDKFLYGNPELTNILTNISSVETRD